MPGLHRKSENDPGAVVQLCGMTEVLQQKRKNKKNKKKNRVACSKKGLGKKNQKN